MVKQLPPQNYVDPLIVISVTIKRGVKIGVNRYSRTSLCTIGRQECVQIRDADRREGKLLSSVPT